MDKRRAKNKFAALREAVSLALREEDPIRLIQIGAPPDEYDPEIGTILPRLREATSPLDVHRIVHEEFVRWFGAAVAGGPERYEGAARRIWVIVSENETV